MQISAFSGHLTRGFVPVVNTTGTGSRVVRRCGTVVPGKRQTRKPRFQSRPSDHLLLRIADWQFSAGLFQLPPRMTRFAVPREVCHLFLRLPMQSMSGVASREAKHCTPPRDVASLEGMRKH